MKRVKDFTYFIVCEVAGELIREGVRYIVDKRRKQQGLWRCPECNKTAQEKKE